MIGAMLVAGVDTGGTFTDFIVFDGRGVRTLKLLSRPGDPAAVVREGMRRLGAARARLVHGSTRATNAFLERKGAKVAFVTNEGFEDLLFVGRQARGSLFDLSWRKPAPPVGRSQCYGVAGRIGPDGKEEERVGRVPRIRGAEIAAVCMLHSYANPAHEKSVGRRLGIPAVLSSELVPEYREYERAMTTVINAYVLPVMRDYLKRLRGDALILASNGGSMKAREAAERPVHTILSGPAGGVTAAASLGLGRAISFDMGGTSTDVAVVEGEPRITKEGTIGGFPLRIPSIDIHTVGAGGGSIARIDRGGALRVGPESAGAKPGPACYGRGGRRPTVTDAHVILGNIDPQQFSGDFRLDTDAAKRAVAPLAKKLRCSLRKAARGILTVAEGNMERAIRRITVERGLEPSDFWLVAFGGAGPLHACALADSVRMKGVVVPPHAGLFSALGMVLADRVVERWRTVLLPATSPRVKPKRGRLFEMRYRGQSYEIRCRSVAEFHRLHRERYGFARRGVPVEVVNAGDRKVVRTRKPVLKSAPRSRVTGPAVISEGGATVLVPKGWKGRYRPDGALVLTKKA